MAKTIGALALANYEDIFQTDHSITEKNYSDIVEIPLSELYPPEFHPFQVNDDDAMKNTVESIKQHGVLVPGIVRSREDGGYELISGNRRKRACELNGFSSMPVMIREMDDDEATIVMIDTNLEQRKELMPSELAWAYRLKLEALNHRGMKMEGIDIGTLSVSLVSQQAKKSKSQIFRYIRLTELVPDLSDMVDMKKIALNPAVELSYLTRKEQMLLLESIGKYESTPSLAQSQILKKHSQAGIFTKNMLDEILSKQKKDAKKEIFQTAQLKKFFPASYTPEQMEHVIIQLLEGWNKGK